VGEGPARHPDPKTTFLPEVREFIFNKEDSTRKGGTVQVRTSEIIIRDVKLFVTDNRYRLTHSFSMDQFCLLLLTDAFPSMKQQQQLLGVS
jgi:hypothetical protein